MVEIGVPTLKIPIIRMKKKLFKAITGFILLITLASFSTNLQMLNFQEKIIIRFNRYLSGKLEEKVYLQTDKPYYSAGENIWFKGYLVNAATLQSVSLSKYLYVELINRMDSVVYRVKVSKDSTGFAGYIILKPDLPSGDYNLRGYTYWMQNNSSDFFFRKNIYIGNRIDDRITCRSNYGTPANGQVPVNLKFTDANLDPLSGKKVQIQGKWWGSGKKRILQTSNSDGIVNFNLPFDPDDRTPYFLDVSINEEALNYKTKIYLPEFSTDFDVQFFPESGVFLDSSLQVIAFKAIGTDGLSLEVAGIIYSKKGVECTEFKTQNNGTGKFILYTLPGESYFAIVKSDKGVEKRFDLPNTQHEGISIHLAFLRNKIVFEIKNQLKNKPGPIFMLIHSNGKPFAVRPIENLTGQISEANFQPGIYVFSIIDTLGNTLCERLFFEKDQSTPTITMKTVKDRYGKRELIDLSFKVQSGKAKTVLGNFSLSVTDNRFVKSDTLCDNIISYLLLSSDIKGHIEKPASYFADDNISSREKLDLLMMTQGWRRYLTSDLVKGNLKQPSFYFEAGQTLSGKVTNIFGKPSQKCDVFALANTIFRMGRTDSLGQYFIDGIHFQDSTSFVLKAKKQKSIIDVEIIPDTDLFPAPNSFFTSPQARQLAAPAEYFDQTKMKYYGEGGMRLIYLDEITVNAAKKTSDTQDQYFSGMGDSQITAENLAKMHSRSILNVLSMVAGVQVSGTQITIRGSSQAPLIIIDGIPTEDPDELSYLTSNDVENIEVFKGASAAIFGSRGGNGVIAISLKRGVVSEHVTPVSMTTIMPLGIQKPEQFYVPKYEVQSIRDDVKPDLRTTIYWNPALSTDSTGIMHVKFYSADQANDYNLILEGITNEGEICRFTGGIKHE